MRIAGEPFMKLFKMTIYGIDLPPCELKNHRRRLLLYPTLLDHIWFIR